MRRYAWPLLPLGAGLGIAWLWRSGVWPNPVAYLRADLAWILTLVALGVSLVWLLAIVVSDLERRRTRKALARMEHEESEARQRFIRRLDHEIKNPLTAIRAGLANLDGDESDILYSVRSQVDRLAHLSADLRKLAEVERQDVEREPVDVAPLLKELVEIAEERPYAAQRQLRLVVPQAPWPLPPVAGDRDLLFLALHNLLDNAFKFSRPADTIEIRAYEDGASVVVEVADTGPGVDSDDLPHLGEELYRGRSAMTVEGSGLGLALVRAIIVRHSGTMSIRSRVGQGTVVTIRLAAAR